MCVCVCVYVKGCGWHSLLGCPATCAGWEKLTVNKTLCIERLKNISLKDRVGICKQKEKSARQFFQKVYPALLHLQIFLSKVIDEIAMQQIACY